MISGVVSGFLGAMAGGLTFITTYNSLTYYFYSNKRYVDWDFRLKNLLIYLASDFNASIAKVFLEARKQLIQMQIYEQPLSAIGRAAALGWFPLMFRDLSFRAILLGTYYTTTDIRHEPRLKYTIPQIADIMRQRRSEGHFETFDEISYMFYDFHSYEVKTRMHIRYLYLILANLLGTVITNPIDVCLTKMMTQQEPKYTGFWQCLRTVYAEEGAWKFLSGVHPRFMLNLFSGSLYLYVYGRFAQRVD